MVALYWAVAALKEKAVMTEMLYFPKLVEMVRFSNLTVAPWGSLMTIVMTA